MFVITFEVIEHVLVSGVFICFCCNFVFTEYSLKVQMAIIIIIRLIDDEIFIS